MLNFVEIRFDRFYTSRATQIFRLNRDFLD